MGAAQDLMQRCGAPGHSVSAGCWGVRNSPPDPPARLLRPHYPAPLAAQNWEEVATYLEYLYPPKILYHSPLLYYGTSRVRMQMRMQMQTP